MKEILKGPAIGPEGDRIEADQSPPGHWPDWFLQDLRDAGALVKTPAPAKKPATPTPPAKKAAAKSVAMTGTSARARREKKS